MLMLTHAWVLENFLGEACFEEKNKDLYIYNICPDFLPIHKQFTSDRTHGVSRFREIPSRFERAAFVHFHLMVDDMSHHGMIDRVPVKKFNPDSGGYTYLKGKPLIQPLMELYRKVNQPVDASVAAYRSHMIIEMMFDLALYQDMPEESMRLVVLMCEAMQTIVSEKLDEFSKTVGWVYNSDTKDVADAMQRCAGIYTLTRMQSFMSLESRIKVFINKFGLDPSDEKTYSALERIMNQGMDLVGDYGEFLDPTLDAVKKVGFNPIIID